MGFLIGLLLAGMLLDSLFLILLVLIQLPKKEAGAGLAFGAGATDALFGAGSGTVLTKITRWTATIFFVLAVFLSIIMSHYYRPGSTRFERELSKTPAEKAPVTAPAPSTPAAPQTVTGTNFQLASSNAPTVSITNPAPALSPALPEAVPTNPAPAPK